jgi:hypothetical protein
LLRCWDRSTKSARSLGFREQGRHFRHAETPLLVDFPTGPLMVGDERVHHVATVDTVEGPLRLLTPTDCVKDRLAAYDRWNDRQSLTQAVQVAVGQRVDFANIRRWSIAEGHEPRYRKFRLKIKRHARQ